MNMIVFTFLIIFYLVQEKFVLVYLRYNYYSFRVLSVELFINNY